MRGEASPSRRCLLQVCVLCAGWGAAAGALLHAPYGSIVLRRPARRVQTWDNGQTRAHSKGHTTPLNLMPLLPRLHCRQTRLSPASTCCRLTILVCRHRAAVALALACPPFTACQKALPPCRLADTVASPNLGIVPNNIPPRQPASALLNPRAPLRSLCALAIRLRV